MQCGQPRGAEFSFDPLVRKKLVMNNEQGCLVWGVRMVIPANLRQKSLKDVHETHPGVSCMKPFGRSCIWWEDMDRDIEKLVFNCETCQINQAMPHKSSVHHWKKQTTCGQTS